MLNNCVPFSSVLKRENQRTKKFNTALFTYYAIVELRLEFVSDTLIEVKSGQEGKEFRWHGMILIDDFFADRLVPIDSVCFNS